MELSAVICVWGDYRRFWPRVWSEIARQAKSGAGPAEVVIGRPPDERGPSSATLAAAFEEASGLPAPVLREAPITDPEPRPGLVRNAALELVSAPLVSFPDVDNHLLPGTWARLVAVHERKPGLGSVAETSVKRLPDGTFTRRASPAYRWDRIECLGPASERHQAILWWLSLRSAVLVPAGVAIHASEALRASGGYGRGRAFEDLVCGVSLLACAPGCYFPRQVGGISEVRPGSLWWRPHPRSEVLETYDEIAERLRELESEGRLRAPVARALPLLRATLSLVRRRAARRVPIDGHPVEPTSSSGSGKAPSGSALGPTAKAALAEAMREEREMAKLLGLQP